MKSAAAYNQNNPAITPGGGGFPAVWEDSRTNYVNLIVGASPGGGQLLKDIYAVQVCFQPDGLTSASARKF